MSEVNNKPAIAQVLAEPLNLGDIVGTYELQGDIEIINECNETLITISYIENNVCTLNKILNPELLARRVLMQGVRDGRLLIKIEGVEDAD